MQPILLVALLLSLASARRQNRLEDLDANQAKEIEYYLGAIHYFWQGFQQDLYSGDKTKLDSRCFDEESMDEIAQLYYTTAVSPTLENFFDSAITMINLFYDDYELCHYEEALSVFITHCKKDPEACRVDSITANLETNVFAIISVATSIGDVSENYSIVDVDDMQDIMLQLGKDASQVAKLLIGMKKSNNHK